MPEDHMNALPPGHSFEGYRVERILGAGGFGITYLAEETALGRSVAIKEYVPAGLAARREGDLTVQPISLSATSDFQWGLDRFKQEAATLVNFDHPNIVRVFRYFEAHGTAYLVMPWVEGETLEMLLRRVDHLDEDKIDAIFEPLLDGLDSVHAAGFLHRDVKPGNILIRADGVPILIDFGAARQALGAQSHTLTAVISEGYAPYEQYEGSRGQSPATDIYALGAVLYRCVSGTRPVPAPRRISARVAGRADPLPPAREAAKATYSAALLDTIDWALAVTPEERPQSIAQFREALAGAASSDAATEATKADGGATLVAGAPSIRPASPAAPAPSPSAASPPPPRKRRNLPLAAALAVILILAAGGVGYWQWQAWQARQEAAAAAQKQRETEALALAAQTRTTIATARAALDQKRYLDARRRAAEATASARKAAALARTLPRVKAATAAAAAIARDVATAIDGRVAALVSAAGAAAKRNAFDAARKALAEAAKLAPEDPRVAGGRNMVAKAEAAYEAAERKKREAAEAKAIAAVRAKITAAKVAVGAAKFDEARKLAAEAVALAKKAPQIAPAKAKAVLAEAQAVSKEVDAAVARKVDALLKNATAAFERKDYKAARARLDDAAKLASADPRIAKLRSRIDDAVRVRGNAWLGVYTRKWTANDGSSVGTGTGSDDRAGLRVVAVAPNGPAAKAGLKPNDIIVWLDGKKIASHDDLRDKLKTTEPGTAVAVIVLRNGRRINLVATLGLSPRADKAACLELRKTALQHFRERQPARIDEAVARAGTLGCAASNRDFIRHLAHYARALQLHRSRDCNGAIAEYANALKLTNTAIAHYNRGLCYSMLRDYKAAIRDYSAAIDLRPTDARFYAKRAVTLAFLNRRAEALRDARKALELKPDNKYYKELARDLAIR